MPFRYISTTSTVFHPDSQTDSQEFVLIYGDEVETTDQQDSGRDEVIYRGRIGWVRSDRLILNHPLDEIVLTSSTAYLHCCGGGLRCRELGRKQDVA